MDAYLADDIPQLVTRAVQAQIQLHGLIKSGDLLRSVQTSVQHDVLGLQIVCSMEDYGVILNERIPFIDRAFEGMEEELMDRIADALELLIEQELNKN